LLALSRLPAEIDHADWADTLLSSKVSTIGVANLSRSSGANPGIIGRRVYQRDNVQLIMLLSRSIHFDVWKYSRAKATASTKPLRFREWMLGFRLIETFGPGKASAATGRA
jgi:hypothetical protein